MLTLHWFCEDEKKREAEMDFWYDFCAIFICCERNMNTSRAREEKKQQKTLIIIFYATRFLLLLAFRDDGVFCGLTQETREIMILWVLKVELNMGERKNCKLIATYDGCGTDKVP